MIPFICRRNLEWIITISLRYLNHLSGYNRSIENFREKSSLLVSSLFWRHTPLVRDSDILHIVNLPDSSVSRICVHIRRGDFHEYCQVNPLYRWSSLESSRTQYSIRTFFGAAKDGHVISWTKVSRVFHPSNLCFGTLLKLSAPIMSTIKSIRCEECSVYSIPYSTFNTSTFQIIVLSDAANIVTPPLRARLPLANIVSSSDILDFLDASKVWIVSHENGMNRTGTFSTDRTSRIRERKKLSLRLWTKPFA